MTLVPHELRQAVVQRAGGVCEYCHLSQETQVATFPVDHIVPVAAGGETDLVNLALACPRCNAMKWTHTAGVDDETGDSVGLFDPRQQLWTDHFRWSDSDPAWLEARSPAARATIGLLDLNSTHRRRVRQWLMVLGLHPKE